jgi:hypothetical protein
MSTTATPPIEDRRTGTDRRRWQSVGVLTLYGPGPLPGTGYNLKQPIALFLQIDEGGRFVVSESNTGAFTFFSAFVEEYEFLSQRESTLSPAMISDLERFRMLLERSEK